MDPVTHFTAGSLAGRAFAGRFGPWRMFVFCFAAAWFPDVDNLFPVDAEGYLLHHRAFTHSLIGLPLLALLLAGAFRLLWRDIPYRRLFWIGLGVMAVQVYLDLATTFGTLILWPLTDHRFAFPGTFIIDPFFTLALLALLVLSLVLKKRRAILGWTGLMLAVLYPLANWGIGTAVEARLESQLNAQVPALRSVEVTTDLFTPIYWKVIADDGQSLWIGALGPLPRMDIRSMEAFPKADNGLLQRLGDKASMFRTWQWFAQFPVIEKNATTGDGREITFLDLRFYSLSPIGRKLIDGYEPPFTLTARLDAEGELEEWMYERHDDKLVTRVPD